MSMDPRDPKNAPVFFSMTEDEESDDGDDVPRGCASGCGLLALAIVLVVIVAVAGLLRG